MIEAFERRQEAADLVRLASLPRERIQAVFVRRGLPEESIDDTIQGLADIGTPITLEDAVSFPFRASSRRVPPFGEGRFHDGHHFGVYYSALDFETCCDEMFFHLRSEGLENSLRFHRYYYVIESSFQGDILCLTDREGEFPHLVSQDHSGYPFCQRLAAEARQANVDALRTRSARREEGVCLPVLNEAALGAHTIARTISVRRVGEDNVGVEDIA